MEELLKNEIVISITGKFSYQTFPLLDKTINVLEEDLEQIGVTKCFDVENNCIIDYDNTEELEAQRLQDLRSKRTPLLEAFDKWEKAVVRGREEDSEEIMSWYRDLLDLKEEAFDNIPARIEYYR